MDEHDVIGALVSRWHAARGDNAKRAAWKEIVAAVRATMKAAAMYTVVPRAAASGVAALAAQVVLTHIEDGGPLGHGDNHAWSTGLSVCREFARVRKNEEARSGPRLGVECGS